MDIAHVQKATCRCTDTYFHYIHGKTLCLDSWQKWHASLASVSQSDGSHIHMSLDVWVECKQPPQLAWPRWQKAHMPANLLEVFLPRWSTSSSQRCFLPSLQTPQQLSQCSRPASVHQLLLKAAALTLCWFPLHPPQPPLPCLSFSLYHAVQLASSSFIHVGQFLAASHGHHIQAQT